MGPGPVKLSSASRLPCCLLLYTRDSRALDKFTALYIIEIENYIHMTDRVKRQKKKCLQPCTEIHLPVIAASRRIPHTALRSTVSTM